MLQRLVTATVGAVLLMTMPGSALAQTTETGVRLLTAYPGIVVEPGSTATFTLVVAGEEGSQAPLVVEGLPEGWTAVFRGDGTTVDRVAVAPAGETPQQLRLDVGVPDGAGETTAEFTVSAGRSALPLSVTVQAGVAGNLTLTPDFPGLRGPSDGTFTFQVTVANDTSADAELELAGIGPEGWDVTAQPTGQTQASAITVPAGQSTTVSLTAQPPVGAEAGLYDIGMTATGEGVDAELGVQVELVGDVALDITTADQRLNAEVTGGEASQLPIVVVNTGTAPLVGVTVTATPPADWEVVVAPEQIEQIAPGETATVTATITPSTDALAGDYDISFSAQVEQASDNVSIRTTVTPSAVWGIVGVGLIALTLAGLTLVFRRFGRR